MLDTESLNYQGASTITSVAQSSITNGRRPDLPDASLRILDREPGLWNLFAYQGDTFLDIPCAIGPYRLRLLIKLNSTEQNFHRSSGGRYIESLMERIRARPQAYFNRNELSKMQDIARAALEYPFKKRK